MSQASDSPTQSRRTVPSERRKRAASSTRTTSASAGRKGVLLIDDHVIVRQGLARLIQQEEDFFVAGEAGDAQSGLKSARKLKPDIVLLDISLPGANGIELLKDLKASQPGLPILVLSMHDESLYAERALRAGAIGYVMKSANACEVITALRKGLRGEFHVSGRINMTILHKALHQNSNKTNSIVSNLSDRELEVFELIGRGIGSRGIAKTLRLSVKTVDSHRAHIKEKLHLRNATELIQHAVRYVESENGG